MAYNTAQNGLSLPVERISPVGAVSDRVRRPAMKECPICLRLSPIGGFKPDRRTKDGLARRCRLCQRARDRRARERRRRTVNRAHRKWRRKPENRRRKAIWSEMWRNRYKPLTILRRFHVYGPPWILDKAERVQWLVDHPEVRSIRTPEQLVAYLGPERTWMVLKSYMAFRGKAMINYCEIERCVMPLMQDGYWDRRTKLHRRIKQLGPPVCPVW